MRYTTANKQWRKPRRRNAPRMIAQIFQWSAIMHMLPWAMKGFLVWHDQPFPRTHDLGKLGKQAIELDPTLAPLIDEVAEFTKYAWMFRYPGDVDEPSVADASSALDRARAFVGALLGRLPEEAR